jgi:hypothetical protein
VAVAKSGSTSDGLESGDEVAEVETTGRELPGVLLPALRWLLPKLEWPSPLRFLKGRLPQTARPVVTEIYVLGVAAIAAIWLGLVDYRLFSFLSGSVARGAALTLVGIRVFELVVFLAKWLFVDRGTPDPPRAILLFCINLVEARLVLCLVAVLSGVLSPSARWQLFFGTLDVPFRAPLLSVPYQLVSWVIVALAVGALAGSLRVDGVDPEAI